MWWDFAPFCIESVNGNEMFSLSLSFNVCACLISRFYRRRKTLCIIHLANIFVLVFASLASSLFFLSFSFVFSEWSPLLIFEWVFFCLTLCKLCTRHTSCTIFCSSSNFDPTFKVAPLKYMLIFFDLPSTINGHLPNHHHLHSNWIFACYNFLQYTAHAHTLFFLVGRSVGRGIVGAAHLIWFLFVCYLFIDCYLLFFWWNVHVLSGRLRAMVE